MDDKTLEGLIVLEYLKLGIIPFFPKKKNLPISALVSSTEVAPKRKFRKLYKKAKKKFHKNSSSAYLNERFGYPGVPPTPIQLARRKYLVWNYIETKVKNDQNK